MSVEGAPFPVKRRQIFLLLATLHVPPTLNPPPMTDPKSKLIDIESEAQFNAALAAAPGEVLVDFVMDGCEACENDKPAVEQLASGCDVTVLRVDVNKLGDLADKFKVAETPTLLHAKTSAGMTPTKAKNVEPEDVVKKLKCAR